MPPAPESAELFPKKVENVPPYVIQALSVSGVGESTQVARITCVR